MRIVFASDTHDRHTGLSVPDGDIFVHAGDFTMNGNLKSVALFSGWIRALPHTHKIVIAGNHELTFERSPRSARQALGEGEDGLIYLQDSGITIDGIAFWGSPWQPLFYNWAFNLRRGPDLAAKWDLIPAGTDVLITHGPPMGILDTVADDRHEGCLDLLRRVADIRPHVHAFGHIHEGAGIKEKDGTIFVNASICDGNYRAVNAFQFLDVNERI